MLKRKDKGFKYWNYTTATCFKHKTQCNDCPNNLVCKMYSNIGKNTYKIHPVKFATLMTYSNIGVKGLDDEFVLGGTDEIHD